MMEKGMKAPQLDYNKFTADFSRAGKPNILEELAQKMKFAEKIYSKRSPMKLSSLIALRPVCVFVILAFIVLLLPSLVIPYWHHKMGRMEYDVNLNSHNVHAELLSEIENTAKLLHPINSSATNLARVLSSSLKGPKLTFSKIQTRVAPSLFQALSTIPYSSQISYIGLDGLFFSYYIDNNQTLAVYSNTSFSFNSSAPNATNNYTWYTQPVNRDTGKLYGEATVSPPLITVNASWFQEALNSPNGYASLGSGWNNAQKLLFLNTARMHGRGAISLGFPVEAITGFFSDTDFHGGNLSLATKNGTMLVEGLPNTHMVLGQVMLVMFLASFNMDGTLNASILNIEETEYMFYCSPLEILGVQSVYVLAFPLKGLVSLVHRNRKLTLTVLIIMIISMVVSILAFMFLMIRAARREMYLCAALIKQMEATQQAERKSMNKSLAFASASHDVRASLAGITGLIEISYHEVAPGSELQTNLRQMEACTKDLLGLLNSILDTSKIEAGKMQLEEEEFNLAELLEDVVDLYHPVAMKKGVDVVLDPSDGSVMKFSHVKGDRGKLKQILCNLLSNAVKFTSEGHVSVRAWVKKPSFENSILASHRNGWLNRLSGFFLKNNEAYNNLEAMNAVQQNPNAMEFVFEVDDTGKGIPKEKHKSVFENYVQVKETALGQGGTGLGLGIVQSLVRLMGGEIGIVDKEIGERGTCFKFNVYLTTSETASIANVKEGDIELSGDYKPSDSHQHLGPTIRTPSPKHEGSRVVLLIQSDERRRISQKVMENLGIKVSVVKHWEHLPHTLKKIKRKMNLSHQSSSGKSDWSSRSDCLSKSASQNSSVGAKDMPLSAMDGTDHMLPAHRRTHHRGAPSFILILIDASAGPFPQLCRAVAEFRRNLSITSCKVVWLDKPTARSIDYKSLEEDKLSSNDHIISKPFHGSRLYQVIGFLPEFGGTLEGTLAKPKRENTFQVGKVSTDPGSSSAYQTHFRSNSGNSPTLVQPIQRGEIQEHDSSGNEKVLRKKKTILQQTEIQECGNPSSEKPLSGKKFLVAEDNPVLRKLAISNLSRLGATVEYCENGQEALELICRGLSDQRILEASMILPYDYVLMDCEMPVMDGFEATRQIRKQEKYFGVHIPIIALTAHTTGEETKKTIQAGMDFHLPKPLNREKLLEAIQCINGK
ncbi:hypothetical protein L1049_004094 [Liquidambar formosana]|uniref:histidine kinase n=1 Tax=Liquidambar formosana TaxID=63359 RepID=A0AAP0WVD6_LIQFO